MPPPHSWPVWQEHLHSCYEGSAGWGEAAGPKGAGETAKGGLQRAQRADCQGLCDLLKEGTAPGPSSPGWLSGCRGTDNPQTAGDIRRTKVSKLLARVSPR